LTNDEASRAVIAFLDQFIARGAAQDVLDVRRDLVADPVVGGRLVAQLGSVEPTEREAYDAMRAFFEIEFKRRDEQQLAGPPGLVLLLSWTEWEPDGGTSDPAQWQDWLAAVQAATAR
jgi:hypothetical protein